MDDRESTTPAQVLFFAILYLFIALLTLSEHWRIVLAFAGPLIGASFVWGVVRKLDRPGDPPHGKRPPDNP